ncbi:hypothetical protein TNCV_3203391 [Trichonephila clavipes]|nr:hypothetical protein TNCV_3203391 [Trichonephila clavipes]
MSPFENELVNVLHAQSECRLVESQDLLTHCRMLLYNFCRNSSTVVAYSVSRRYHSTENDDKTKNRVVVRSVFITFDVSLSMSQRVLRIPVTTVIIDKRLGEWGGGTLNSESHRSE